MSPTVTIVIDIGNAAFTDDFGPELARVLRNLAARARECTDGGEFVGTTARDSNGNHCATVFGRLPGAPSA